MSKKDLIQQIENLYDADDMQTSYDEGYDEGYLKAEKETDVTIQELRNSLHVFLQEGCFGCGYAPPYMRREVVSEDRESLSFTCPRCKTSQVMRVMAISIEFDGEEVR